MSKLIFTSEQIRVLRRNPYVKNVSEKSITYSDEFKRHFVSESLDSKTAKQIFIEAGFDPEMLGESRIRFSSTFVSKFPPPCSKQKNSQLTVTVTIIAL